MSTRTPCPAPAPETAGGHAVTAGAVLIGMSVVGIAGSYLLGTVLGLELGFISALDMCIIGLANLALGLYLVLTGRRDRTPA